MTDHLNPGYFIKIFLVFLDKMVVIIKTQTARTIKTLIRSNFIFSLCTSKGTNCEPTQEN